MGIIIDNIIRQFVAKDPFVMNYVQVGIDKLILQGAIVPFNESVNFGTPRVDEVVRNGVFLLLSVK